MPPKPSRGWTFTLNNYTGEDEIKFQAFECDYMVYGHEKGLEGTPHLQGYLYIKKKISMKALKAKLSATAHWETAIANAETNLKYCTKDDKDFFTKGIMPKHGKRTDLEAVKLSIDNGATKAELWEQHFTQMTLYHKSFNSYITAQVEPRSEPPNVIWIWGPPGTGKTRQAFESTDDLYSKDCTKWWDNYVGQTTTLIDDIRAKSFSYRYILRMLDRYPFQVQTKGGYINFNSKIIYITSPYHPKHFSFQCDPTEDPEQLLRRITEIIFIGNPA